MIATRLISFFYKKPKGSAFLELLVVFVIAAALFTIIVPTYFDYLNKAKLTLAHNTINSVGKALTSYKHNHHIFPARINFTTGKDDFGTTVLQQSLLDQTKTDFSSIESYVATKTTYTLTVRATDKNLTVIILTPSKVTF